MKINKTTVFFIIIIILVLGAIFTVIYKGNTNQTPNKYDSFATCLKDKGAIFYGAFWCSHCNAEKKLFGSSAKLLPYVECSTPDGQGQNQICKDKGIEGYPTWVFADGSKLVGEVALEELSNKTSCPLP